MRITPKYQFKIKELKDSPPDITVGEDNWDKIETQLIKMENATAIAYEKFQFEAWSNMPGAVYQQVENNNIYTTTLFINNVKKAQRKEFPKDAQGEYITVETVYRPDGTEESITTMKEYQVGNDWKMEVI